MTSSLKFIVDDAFIDISENSRKANQAEKNSVNEWKEQLVSLLEDNPLPLCLSQEITLYEASNLLTTQQLRRKINFILDKITEQSDFYEQARDLVAKNSALSDEYFSIIFYDQWQQCIENSVYQYQMQLIDESREALLTMLKERHENLETLNELVDSELLDDVGRLWDLSQSKLTHIDITLLQRFSKNLAKNKAIVTIANQLGRLALSEVSTKKTPPITETWVLDDNYQDNVPDEMQGVSYSNEISRMLQTEIINLSFPELEIIFYKRYLERHLLSYQYQGADQQYKKQINFQQGNDQQGDEVGGPFIVCIDSSGSMQGTPELTAKSICYALTQIAFAQKRACYLMMFSSQVITFPVTKETTLSAILTFLSASFRGGTDLKPVIEQSLDLMKHGEYKNADLLVISDFIAQKLPSVLAFEVHQLKKQKNRFHAITLSSQGNPELMGIFDHIWKYSSFLGASFTRVK
jgi:uncharacterized protein with von Willebrand factor type A (vWA) domain